MQQESIPVEEFCVAAGIPSTEKAAKIIRGLHNTLQGTDFLYPLDGTF